MAGFHGAAGAGRAGGGGHARFVQDHQQGLALDAVDDEVAVAGRFFLAGGVSCAPGMRLSKPLSQLSRRLRTRSEATARSGRAASSAAAMPTMPATL